MGTAGSFTPEKLVMGILSSLPDSDEQLRSLLVEQWGRMDYCSAPIPFTFTDYYDREMGGAIERSFVVLRAARGSLLPCPRQAARPTGWRTASGTGGAPGEPGSRPHGPLPFLAGHDEGERAPHPPGCGNLCGDHAALQPRGASDPWNGRIRISDPSTTCRFSTRSAHSTRRSSQQLFHRSAEPKRRDDPSRSPSL